MKENKNCKKKILEEEDWICGTCKASYLCEKKKKISKKWLECDQCHKPYQFKCIPRRQRETYGLESESDEDEEVKFICHNCESLSDGEFGVDHLDEDNDE